MQSCNRKQERVLDTLLLLQRKDPKFDREMEAGTDCWASNRRGFAVIEVGDPGGGGRGELREGQDSGRVAASGGGAPVAAWQRGEGGRSRAGLWEDRRAAAVDLQILK
jgi:hypothetical protein